MKEIGKNTIVKHPAFGGEVTRGDIIDLRDSTVKKRPVLIVLLKLNQGKTVLLGQRTHLVVVTFADRTRNAGLNIKLL